MQANWLCGVFLYPQTTGQGRLFKKVYYILVAGSIPAREPICSTSCIDFCQNFYLAPAAGNLLIGESLKSA